MSVEHVGEQVTRILDKMDTLPSSETTEAWQALDMTLLTDAAKNILEQVPVQLNTADTLGNFAKAAHERGVIGGAIARTALRGSTNPDVQGLEEGLEIIANGGTTQRLAADTIRRKLIEISNLAVQMTDLLAECNAAANRGTDAAHDVTAAQGAVIDHATNFLAVHCKPTL
jgi:hypothetical protein